MSEWPRPLSEVAGPMRPDKVHGAAEGMGLWGEATRALIEEGWLTPDLLTGMTLFVLSGQPRDPQKSQRIPGGGGGVAGGVWVRERFVIHQPLRADARFVVRGEALGRHIHKGRRYGTNRSATYGAGGELVAANLTTGLLQYQADMALADALEGQHPDSITAPQPDWKAASNNPCLAPLSELRAGDRFAGEEVLISLEMMAARDTKQPDNPIHSDPQLARRAGLERPIAGGSHVLAFVLELILRHVGRQVLYHGAAFDIRWKAPVYADTCISPIVTVAAADASRIEFFLEARCADGRVALTGQVVVPAGGPQT